jgi:calcium-dependent protein kinase
MKAVDTDGSGFIDYSEFIAATMNKKTLLSSENMESAFKAFDKDKSGSISIAELKTMLGGASITDAVW